MRRNSLDVSVDILEAALGGANKTRIVYKSNLNFEIVKGYMRNLMGNGLLEVNDDGKFVTTKSGLKFVRDYRNLMEPLNQATAPSPRLSEYTSS